MINQPTIKLRLRYVLAFLIVVSAGLFFQLGISSKIGTWNEKREIQKAYELVAEDLRTHAKLKRALRAAQAESEGDDFLTDICANDPSKCK